MNWNHPQYSELRAFLGGVAEGPGIRSPADAVRLCGLTDQAAELVGHGVPYEVADRIVLVSYGKALHHGSVGIGRALSFVADAFAPGKRNE